MSLAKTNLTVPILGYGTCKQLGNVLYVPVVDYCLLSTRQLDDQGFEVRFSQGYARVSVHEPNVVTTIPKFYADTFLSWISLLMILSI